jgi:hypothetical protein
MLNRPNTTARQQIKEQMDRMRPVFTAIYCSEDPKEAPVSFKYVQRRIVLPPMAKVPITDLTGVPKDKAYDMSSGRPQPWRGKQPKEKVTLASAEKVIGHAIAVLWKRGVTMLTGNPVTDNQNIQEATVRWREDRQLRDEAVMAAFHKREDEFISNPANKGRPRPIMGKLERESQTRLDNFRLAEYNAPVGTEMRCQYKDCSYWSPDAEELARHAQASHADELEITGDAAVAEKAAEEREAKRQEKRRQTIEEKRQRIEAEMKEAPPAILSALEGPQA